MNPFVHSNYARRLNDHYPTIDPRCVWGLLEHINLRTRRVIDNCAPKGSSITKELHNNGIDSWWFGDAFGELKYTFDWIVTNPPYDKGIVDEILFRQIDRLESGEVFGFASLHRTGFDHAKGRYKSGLFNGNPFYRGQIKLCFRPYWSDKPKKHEPIHQFVWHIWTSERGIPPQVYYSLGEKL